MTQYTTPYSIPSPGAENFIAKTSGTEESIRTAFRDNALATNSALGLVQGNAAALIELGTAAAVAEAHAAQALAAAANLNAQRVIDMAANGEFNGSIGLPGVNAVANDTAVAQYVNDGASLTRASLDGTFSQKKTLVEELRFPLIIAHRGSRLIFPEQSMEGMRASAQEGFPPETDVQFLADGTLVCLHDDTVDRSMTGQTGLASNLTREQWLAMRIRPALKGGKDAQPYFFDQYLDELGGKFVLFPELKQTATASEIATYIHAIKSRSLEGSVVAQTFTWATAVQFADAGLNTLWAFNGTPSRTPAQIAAAGIRFCGLGSGVTPATIAELKSLGIRTFGYTYNTAESYEARLADGVDGVFSDDPWKITRRLPAASADPFAAGYGWPGMAGETKSGSTYSNYPVAVAGNALDLYQHPTDTANLKWVYQDWAGRRNLPLRVSLKIQFEASAAGQTNNAGFVLYRNSLNPDAGYKDAAEPGQQALAFVARRNGTLDGWTYVNGATGEKVITRAASGEYAPSGLPGSVELVVTMTSSKFTIEVPSHGQIVTVPYSFIAGGPLRLALRASLAGARVSDVRVTDL